MEEEPRIKISEFLILAGFAFAMIMGGIFARPLPVLPTLIEWTVFAMIDSKNQKLARGYKLLPLWLLFTIVIVAAGFPEKTAPIVYRFIEKIHYLDI